MSKLIKNHAHPSASIILDALRYIAKDRVIQECSFNNCDTTYMFFDEAYHSPCKATYIRNEKYGSYIKFAESWNGRYLQHMLNDFFNRYGIYADLSKDNDEAQFMLYYYSSHNNNTGFSTVEECESTQRRVRSNLIDICLKFIDDYGERNDICGWDKVHNDYDKNDCYITMLERKNVTHSLHDLTTDELILLAKELKKSKVFCVGSYHYETMGEANIEAYSLLTEKMHGQMIEGSVTFEWDGATLYANRGQENEASITITEEWV